MRTKALILGVTPHSPFEGPWVPIGEAGAWQARVVCDPPNVKLDGELRIEVEVGDHVLSLPLQAKVKGEFARVVLIKEIDLVRQLSIILEG